MKFSHSKVEAFVKCPYAYKLKYIDLLKPIKDVDDAINPLYIGTGIHTAIEKGVDEGVKAYYAEYPVIDDLHVNEAIKIELLAPKVQRLFEADSVTFEYKLDFDDQFIGYIDALVDLGGNNFAIYDFKYSNKIERYAESSQLHLYKWFFELLNPNCTVTELHYVFIPKLMIRQKKTESLGEFRLRLINQLSNENIKVIDVEFDYRKVINYFVTARNIESTIKFDKQESKLCDWCEFKSYCQEGLDYMILPPCQRRLVNPSDRKKIWVYGAPFSGKTTLANQFPKPIMFNTDGNIFSFDAPYVEIKDTYDGRIKTSAWENLKSAVELIVQGKHEFETVVVDLVEDTFEYCRKYCYVKLNIEHESDNSFKAWDYVRVEFLSVFKQLMTAPYNVVLISHEDTTKDITRKNGDKYTSIMPNIQNKIANKLAGMVDIVARVIADGDNRTLNFKCDEVTFGGGRLKLNSSEITCSYEALDLLYKEQVQNVSAHADLVLPQPVDVVQSENQPIIVSAQPAQFNESQPLTQDPSVELQTLMQNQINSYEQEIITNQAEINALQKASDEIKAIRNGLAQNGQSIQSEASNDQAPKTRRSRRQLSEIKWEPDTDEQESPQPVERTRRIRRNRTQTESAQSVATQTNNAPF